MDNIWKDLEKPEKVEIEEIDPPKNYGKFVCGPLERGFGLTLGNALRRVMLSSLQGAAIISAKVEGVSHEFSTLPGVAEDIFDIILNLKEVRLKHHGQGVRTARLEAVGPKIVKAGDIITDHMLEVLNKDLHLATLAKNGRLFMELQVATGKSYAPAERPPDTEQIYGQYPVDALFSPIRKVNFLVQDARKGSKTDYDRLTLEVWTDGSLTPQEAVAASANILLDQLDIFTKFEEMAIPSPARQPSGQTRDFDLQFAKPVDELELSVRSANCLKNADIYFIGDLVQKTEQEMLKTKNFGRKSLNEIKIVLHNIGLHLGMPVDGYVRPDNRKD
ncbi:MAG: DNA-directed RNA polymerase subunit alpha [Deltaproteobacteria bacterium]|jgi:DNA-directed RNA polymerase subunit alpha|nr:DNA-directed RNA polymerase subunit alpha [Deltaproteobacteria bacterium]